MKHPCTKECLKYIFCKQKKVIVCSELYDYQTYLIKIYRGKSFLTQSQHEKIWTELRKNLPLLQRLL